MSFKIYKDDEVIVEGESPLSITGLNPDTDVPEGEYQVVRVEDDRESERVDIPAFKTLPIEVTGVELSPKTSTAESGEAGSRELSASVSPSNATNKGVSYSTDDAEGLTVSSGGKIEWTADTPAGDYTTTVTTDDGGHTDTHVLTLEEPLEPEPDPEEGE